MVGNLELSSEPSVPGRLRKQQVASRSFQINDKRSTRQDINVERLILEIETPTFPGRKKSDAIEEGRQLAMNLP
jgi:hypothetical protein